MTDSQLNKLECLKLKQAVSQSLPMLKARARSGEQPDVRSSVVQELTGD
jgi:hypothetical protein